MHRCFDKKRTLIGSLSEKWRPAQSYATTKRGTNIAVWIDRLATLGAFELEQLRMFQGAAHEGAQSNKIWSNLGHPAATVGHLYVEGNEV